MPPTSGPSSVSLKSAITLLEHIQSFLLLSIHSLLHARALYPPSTFLTTRAFNVIVRQSRHPRVCSWVKDAVSSICAQLATGTVDKVVFAVFSPSGGKGKDAKEDEVRVLERWVFDLGTFPALPEGSWRGANETPNEFEEGGATADIEDEEGDTEESEEAEEGKPKDDVNWADVGESLRGGLRRLQIAGEASSALPKGCTFTMAVELKDESVAPIGHPQPWIPTDPKQQVSSHSERQIRPIRSVSAGPLFFEIYLEEAGSVTVAELKK